MLLVYASRSPADVIFGDELNAIEAGDFPMLKVIHVLSNAPASWVGETGRLDADRLARLCGSVEDQAFYLCCPPPMTALIDSWVTTDGCESASHPYGPFLTLTLRWRGKGDRATFPTDGHLRGPRRGGVEVRHCWASAVLRAAAPH